MKRECFILCTSSHVLVGIVHVPENLTNVFSACYSRQDKHHIILAHSTHLVLHKITRKI